MFKKILTITLLIIAVIGIQRVDCFNGKRSKRTIKELRPNCKEVDHLGKCVNNVLISNIVLANSKKTPKRMAVTRVAEAEEKKSWWSFSRK